MSRKTLTRRQFVAATAMSSAALITAPYVRGAYAAGKLSIGFWDHWVPGANDASTALVKEWGEREKVEVSIDYITSNNKKIELTAAAEAQAKSGHDILQMPSWWPHAYSENLEPLNDVMEPLIKQNGEVNDTVKYLGRSGGKWLAVPATPGSQIKGPCSRIDLMKKHAGIDVQEMYPAGGPPKADNWTMETFLKAAEACHKAGFPFGIGLGETTDSVDTAGRDLPVIRRRAGQRQGRYHRQDRRGQTGTRILQEADRRAAHRRTVLGRCLQQQMADLGPRGDDPQSAECLGGRQARRTASRRTVLDARLPIRSEGTFCALPAVLLGRLGLWQEQGSGQELARSPVLARGDREVRRGERRVRSPGLREHDEVQDLGRGRAAEGHALPLSGSLQAADACRSPRLQRRRRSPSRSTSRRR